MGIKSARWNQTRVLPRSCDQCTYELSPPNREFAQKPLEPSDGFFGVRIKWLIIMMAPVILSISSLAMEVQILEASLSFHELLFDLLDTLDNDWINRQGRFRPNGRVDLYDLGDDIWREQFR
ncbi:hypothetical protein K438DRAFT_1776658 [Mycena galopus ATCC 62051]|nr:hypothetical protein K438DRAFT_1776658 [Mycena galopus ATCC 62051]